MNRISILVREEKRHCQGAPQRKFSRGKDFMIRYTGEYSDIPLPDAARQTQELPGTLEALRRMTREGNTGAEELFYRQAKLAENYEDDSVYSGEFIWYNPTYERMNNRVLRGYFGWRTRLRAGKAEAGAPVSFAYVLAYELMDGVGEQGEAGFKRMKQLQDMFGERSAAFATSMNYWLHDFIIYNDLPVSLAPELFTGSARAAAARILEAAERGEKQDPEEFLTACQTACTARAGASAFARKYRGDFAQVLMRALYLAGERDRRCGRGGLAQRCLGGIVRIPWYPFRSAPFFDYRAYKDFRYEAGCDQVYTCRDGNWTRQARSLTHSVPYPGMGELCQETDRQMRQAWHFGHPLKQGAGAWFEEPVKEALEAYLREKEEAARPRITLDMGSLGKIRRDADTTRDALLVDEEESPVLKTAPEIQAPEILTPGPEILSAPGPAKEPESRERQETSGAVLTDDEREILRRIAQGGDWKGYAAEHRLMLSMTVDSINEKLMEKIGDTVLEWDGDAPEVIEDYREDIRAFYEQ
jgi:hypothetical protein